MLGKIDKTVQKETLYIAIWVLALSFVMEIIVLLIGKWDVFFLLGNLLSAFICVANFLLMGIGVQKALLKNDEKEAKQVIKVSHMLRTLGLILLTVLGVVFFNIWAVIIPLIFPRIALIFRSRFNLGD